MKGGEEKEWHPISVTPLPVQTDQQPLPHMANGYGTTFILQTSKLRITMLFVPVAYATGCSTVIYEINGLSSITQLSLVYKIYLQHFAVIFTCAIILC